MNVYAEALCGAFAEYPFYGKGWLYFMVSSPPPGVPAPVKVGYSENVPQRLTILATSSPWPLRIYGAFRQAPLALEQEVHRRFRPLREPNYLGEWYGPDALEALADLPQDLAARFVLGETSEMDRGFSDEGSAEVSRCGDQILRLVGALGKSYQGRQSADLRAKLPEPTHGVFSLAVCRLVGAGHLRFQGHGRRGFYLTQAGQKALDRLQPPQRTG